MACVPGFYGVGFWFLWRGFLGLMAWVLCLMSFVLGFDGVGSWF